MPSIKHSYSAKTSYQLSDMSPQSYADLIEK